MTPPTDLDTPVLIVGSGPVGLAASITISRSGISSVLVERHPGTSIHPKARGLNVRTMEIVRQWGIEDAVQRAGLPPETHGFFYRGKTLLSPEFERTGGGGLAADAHALSPAAWLVISQDALEPVLVAHARSLGRTEFLYEHELLGLEVRPDGGGVIATVRDRRAGRDLTVAARYVVGADGAESLVRALRGIELRGHGPLVDNVSILFEASLGDLIADRRSAVYFLSGDAGVRPRDYPMSVGNPPPNGVLLTVDNADRWLLVVGLYGDDARAVDEFDAAHATRLVKRAIGRDDVPVRILGTMPWSPAARVAASYRNGPAFVAGDAAHEMTPSGAFGLNVGIQDAHNLGWKLGAVLGGWAGEALLDSYDAERRPAGEFAAEQSYLQFLGTRPPRPFGNWGVILGAAYASDAIVPDGTPAPELADPAVDYVPRARPGSRAPHAWLRRGADRISSLDLYGDGLVLVAGRDGSDWVRAARASAAALEGVAVDAVQVGRTFAPEDPARFEADHEIGNRGAILVRPDGYVAWRACAGPPTDAPSAFGDVLRAVVARP